MLTSYEKLLNMPLDLIQGFDHRIVSCELPHADLGQGFVLLRLSLAQPYQLCARPLNPLVNRTDLVSNFLQGLLNGRKGLSATNHKILLPTRNRSVHSRNNIFWDQKPTTLDADLIILNDTVVLLIR